MELSYSLCLGRAVCKLALALFFKTGCKFVVRIMIMQLVGLAFSVLDSSHFSFMRHALLHTWME